jgi:hypothetical protein
MDALKKKTGRDVPKDRPAPQKQTARPIRPGANWRPEDGEALDIPVPPVARTPESVIAPEPVQQQDAPEIADKTPVDDVFGHLNSNSADAPVSTSLLLSPADRPMPASPVPAWRQTYEETEEIAPPKAIKAELPEKPRPSRRWPIAAGLVLAVALGPLAATFLPDTRPINPPEPVFGLQPALGITSPFAELPATTYSGEWRPRQAVAPGGPLRIAQIVPPTFVRGLEPLGAGPDAGPGQSGVDWPLPAYATPERLVPFAPMPIAGAAPSNGRIATGPVIDVATHAILPRIGGPATLPRE